MKSMNYKELKSFIEIESENKNPWSNKFELSRLRNLIDEAESLGATHFDLEIRNCDLIVSLYRQLNQKEVVEAEIDSLAERQLELQLELERLEDEG